LNLARFHATARTPDRERAVKPILTILHQEHSTPGRVGRLLLERGFSLDIRRPRSGDPLPETMAEHAGVVVFGGPGSANDPEDYVRQEIDWLEVPLKEEKPIFGICLGAQFLARTLGARVDFHPEGLVEVGYYPLDPTPVGASLMPWPDHVYHFHREGFDLPAGAELLARGTIFENQAFRYGEAAYGVQFHPEVTHQMMCRWTTRAAHRLELPGARPRAEHFDGRPQHDPKVRNWLTRFLDHWTGLIRRDARASAA
jgi:GMP synthase (glutamine-hydrolysing)